MSVTKRISGDYNIVNKANGLTTGNVTITTDTFFVNGNMLVGGTATSVEQTNSYITDNVITLNKGETGAGVTLIYSGIEVETEEEGMYEDDAEEEADAEFDDEAEEAGEAGRVRGRVRAAGDGDPGFAHVDGHAAGAQVDRRDSVETERRQISLRSGLPCPHRAQCPTRVSAAP